MPKRRHHWMKLCTLSRAKKLFGFTCVHEEDNGQLAERELGNAVTTSRGVNRVPRAINIWF